MSTHAYCEEKGTPAGSTAYYRRLFAPAESQPAITALYALAAEVRAIPDDVSEPGAARMKVAWWQAELERLFEGNPGHPVTRELAGAVKRHGLGRERFDSLVALADIDIEHPGYTDADALLERATRAADLQRLESDICGYDDPDTVNFAERLGIALELSRIVRDLRLDAAQGRIHVPADELETHGVRPGDLLQPETGTGVRALLAEQVRRARTHLDEAERALPDADRRRQASGLVAVRLERTLLAEIERDGYRVLEHRIALTPVRKFWLAWRTARGACRKARRAQGKSRQ
ncbi:MAG: squalene/phytoene synthase family protein [Halofilum sp. (in: g-proteobacteria)]|nr:squalene/phytoene synthase family protein [Halofilum sp. (in: g-proteobacteria)]